MRARLGFSVAVNVDPDILLVDEALSTGDALFKAKGIQKMRDLLTSGVTVLFVSHSKAQVNEFCTEAILLHKGRLMSRGDTDQVMDEYKNLLVNESAKQENQPDLEGVPSYKVAQGGGDKPETPEFKENLTVGNKGVRLRPGTGEARIQHVELLDDHDRPVDTVMLESNLTVRAHVQYAEDVDESIVDIAIRNRTGIDIFSTSTSLKETPIGSRRAGEQVIVNFTFGVPLQQGNYSVHASIRHPERKGKPLDWIDVAAVFKVLHPSTKVGFKGMVDLPTRVEVFEPKRVR
jgi:ABC-type multidrug transport system ATPase subunit